MNTRFTDGVEVWHSPEEDSWEGVGERRWGASEVRPWDDPWAEERYWAEASAAREAGIKRARDRLAQNVITAVRSAVSEGKNLLLIGRPGSGRTMLARRIVSLLPPLSEGEALEISSIYSVAGVIRNGQGRPFRAPHCSCSDLGLVGRGVARPRLRNRPGEVSLAHGGVLFLDELPEFRGAAIEALGDVLRRGEAVFSRKGARASFPAKPMVIAAANPCPCGYHGTEKCACRPERVAAYMDRVREFSRRLGIGVTIQLFGPWAMREPKNGRTNLTAGEYDR